VLRGQHLNQPAASKSFCASDDDPHEDILCGMRIWLKLVVAACAALVLACGGLMDSTLEVPPRGATESEAPEPLVSVLNIPMTITYAMLQESVEAGMPSPLYSDKNQELPGRLEMDTTIKRASDPRVFQRSGALIIEVPTKVKVKVYRRKLNGERGSSLGTGSAKLTVRISTTPTIEDDWSMIGNTEITWRWDDSPSIRVATVDIELNDRLDDKIDAAMADAAKEIDAALLEEAPLRVSVEETWKDLGLARQLKRSPSVWMRFEPEAFFSDDPQMTGRGMEITIGAQGVLETSLSQRMSDIEVAPLADRQDPTSDSGARLNVPVQLAWDALKSTLALKLEGMVFEASGASATITELVAVYPSGEKIAVGLKLNIETPAGSTEAEAWAAGRPALDSAGERITLEDFTYDAATGQSVIDAAHDALREDIVAQIQELLTVPFADEIDGITTTFTEVLEGVELSEGVLLSGSVSKVRMRDVRLTDQHLIIDVSVVCDLSLSVQATGSQ